MVQFHQELRMTMQELMLDIEGLARKLGVSVATARRIAKRGELPTYRIGGQLRFRDEEIDVWINKQQVRPNETNTMTNTMTNTSLHTLIENREWFDVTGLVSAHCKESTTDEHGADTLQDWLSHGSYDGTETAESIAAEWDELVRDTIEAA